MGTSHRRAVRLWMLMHLRRLGFGRNPLRRRADRLEAALLLAVSATAVLVIPAAAMLGTAIRDHIEHAAAQQRAELRQVSARTLDETSASAGPGQFTARVRIAWVDRSGTYHESLQEVLAGTRPGTQLTFWTDSAGVIRPAPRAPADSAALGTVAGMTLSAVAWPLLFAGFRFARRPLDRSRAKAWERDWERVAPRWTRP